MTTVLRVGVDGAILAAFVTAMSIIGGAAIDVRTIAWLIFGAVVIVTAGVVMVQATFGRDTPARHALAMLLGSIATSMVLLGGCVASGSHAGIVFLWWSAGVLGAAVWVLGDAPVIDDGDRWEPLAIGLLAVLVAYWCHRPAGLWPALQATGISTVWSDYSIHGASVAEFGAPLTAGLSSFLLVGEPLVFYHYASFMLPAAAAAVVDLPPWGLAASLLLPYGIFLMTLGVYAVTRLLATPGLAVIAPVLLLLVPDASTVGLKNGFFGFHWLLLTAPGSGYGVAAVFAAIAAIVAWRRQRRMATFWLACVITISIFEFRAQIFVLFVATLTLTLFSESSFTRRHPRGVLLTSMAVALMVIVTVLAVPAIRAAWLHFSAVQRFVTIVHSGMAPTAYDGVYQALEQRLGSTVASAVGLIALVPAALGGLTIALPATLIIAVRRTRWLPLDSLAVCCLAAWLGLVLVAAASSRSGPAEYQHRPFVLVYAAAFVWTLIFLRRSIPDAMLAPSRRRIAIPLVVIGTVVLGAATGADERARPRFAWGARHFGKKTDRGVIDAAAYVRAHAQAGDVFALTPTEPSEALDDKATELASLAGVPAYLARVGIQVVNGDDRRAVTMRRLAELTQVETTTDAEVAFLTLRRASVDFLVVVGDGGPQFDPAGSRAAFRTTGAVVYRIARP